MRRRAADGDGSDSLPVFTSPHAVAAAARRKKMMLLAAVVLLACVCGGAVIVLLRARSTRPAAAVEVGEGGSSVEDMLAAASDALKAATEESEDEEAAWMAAGSWRRARGEPGDGRIVPSRREEGTLPSEWDIRDFYSGLLDTMGEGELALAVLNPRSSCVLRYRPKAVILDDFFAKQDVFSFVKLSSQLRGVLAACEAPPLALKALTETVEHSDCEPHMSLAYCMQQQQRRVARSSGKESKEELETLLLEEHAFFQEASAHWWHRRYHAAGEKLLQWLEDVQNGLELWS
eukprot:PLAT758.1.p1 GENE.PLAT758.1~~PLAT758.1.p1  ORF type:complete len:290 (-),score=115.98 PLAT758.1:181-1050(-)